MTNYQTALLIMKMIEKINLEIDAVLDHPDGTLPFDGLKFLKGMKEMNTFSKKWIPNQAIKKLLNI
jgi:hypothetical protein